MKLARAAEVPPELAPKSSQVVSKSDALYHPMTKLGITLLPKAFDLQTGSELYVEEIFSGKLPNLKKMLNDSLHKILVFYNSLAPLDEVVTKTDEVVHKTTSSPSIAVDQNMTLEKFKQQLCAEMGLISEQDTFKVFLGLKELKNVNFSLKRHNFYDKCSITLRRGIPLKRGK